MCNLLSFLPKQRFSNSKPFPVRLTVGRQFLVLAMAVRIRRGEPLRDRLTAGREFLVLAIEVRILVLEPLTRID